MYLAPGSELPLRDKRLCSHWASAPEELFFDFFRNR
jgi:hypothetical protein